MQKQCNIFVISEKWKLEKKTENGMRNQTDPYNFTCISLG